MSFKLNPFTGEFDEVNNNTTLSPENFSHEEVRAEKTIPLYQQMIVMGGIIIEDILNIDGTLVLED